MQVKTVVKNITQAVGKLALKNYLGIAMALQTFIYNEEYVQKNRKDFNQNQMFDSLSLSQLIDRKKFEFVGQSTKQKQQIQVLIVMQTSSVVITCGPP